MFTTVRKELRSTLDEMRRSGPWAAERVITSPQGATIDVEGEEVLNLCANNYLGLANHPEVVAAAREGLARWGFGTAGGRLLCGTQDIHRQLEGRLTEFLGTEGTILFSSCYDANTGLFETLLGEDDAVISDALNHASIIDGIRLSKARRYRYANGAMDELEQQLHRARQEGAGRVLIASDGVFSMDGCIAPLDEICDLAEQFDAMVMVDDSHAVGIVGRRGRGTHELLGVTDRVDVLTGTLGKALGGASGGYVSGRAEIVELLRQRSRPYLYSNSLAPPIAAASLAVLDLLERSDDLRLRLAENTALFRGAMEGLGFDILPGQHPIVPIMTRDAGLATDLAAGLFDEGIFVVGISYPVVPREQSRIRTQMSASHSPADLARAAEAFATVRDRLGAASPPQVGAQS